MARLSFAELSPFVYVGSDLGGVLELEVDQPFAARSFTLTLVGKEHTQTVVQQGKSSTTRTDERVFLEVVVPLEQSWVLQDPEHVRPGLYRVPFRFRIPENAPPSFATSPLEEGRRSLNFPNGAFLLYELTAKVDVPWWTGPLLQAIVPVLPTARNLGSFLGMRSPPKAEHPEVVVLPANGATPWIVPGSPFSVQYQVTNPKGKGLKELSVDLVRVVDYQVQGIACTHRLTVGNFVRPLEGEAPAFEGEMDLMVPNGPELLNPGRGELFQAQWELTAAVGVHWGFSVKASVLLGPPGPPPAPPVAPG